jgi:hypothetical protein
VVCLDGQPNPQESDELRAALQLRARSGRLAASRSAEPASGGRGRYFSPIGDGPGSSPLAAPARDHNHLRDSAHSSRDTAFQESPSSRRLPG